jgi:hypothetical protein
MTSRGTGCHCGRDFVRDFDPLGEGGVGDVVPAQSSTFNPDTRVNSVVLFVTSVNSRALP